MLEGERSIRGSEDAVRQSKVGDVGKIFHVPTNSDLMSAPICIDKSVNDEGITVWLVDFQEDELEFVVYES